MRLNLFFLVPFLIVLIACNDSKELEGVNVQKKQNTAYVRNHQAKKFWMNKDDFFILEFHAKASVPRPLSFLKNTSSQTSSLVLIFSKKVGFSLGKIKKVADSVQHSH